MFIATTTKKATFLLGEVAPAAVGDSNPNRPMTSDA